MKLSGNNIFKASLLFSLAFPAVVSAKEIKMNTAQMQAMDKITGRVKVIEVPVNSNVEFGTFSILVRDCQTRPPEETPENFAFVDIVDNNTDGSKFNIFRGWMMSSTPALNAVEHPIYDVWLLKCIDTDVDKKTLLSAEELEIRNNIPKLAIKEEKTKKGEPTNLLSNLEPSETEVEIETTIETTIETEEQIVVKGLVPDETYTNENNNVIYEGFEPKDESIIINTDIIEKIKTENVNPSDEDSSANQLINFNNEKTVSDEIIEDPAEVSTSEEPIQNNTETGNTEVQKIVEEQKNEVPSNNDIPSDIVDEYSDFEEVYD